MPSESQKWATKAHDKAKEQGSSDRDAGIISEAVRQLAERHARGQQR